MLAAYKHWRAMQKFQALPRDQRQVVFYSEGPAYSVHLLPIAEKLLSDTNLPVAYLTSDELDPALGVAARSRMSAFHIGAGAVRTALFRVLDADVVVMSTPDLENFYLKRSHHDVHYIYVHHSLVSTHMVYNLGAFDHFDTVFCVGPHHAAETRETEALYNLRPKAIFEHGYARLDSLMQNITAESPPVERTRPKVLVAPSWGPNGLLESHGEALVDSLADGGFEVIVRPHPMTSKLAAKSLAALEARWHGDPLVRFSKDISAEDDLLQADIMISDWSGAALEFAFSRLRPVLFIDVPRKVNNAEYSRLASPPLEVSIREQIGGICAPERMQEDLARQISGLLAAGQDVSNQIERARSKYVYNPGCSSKAAAAKIAEMVRS